MGAMGPPGPAGADGAQGMAGPTGPVGPQGIPGPVVVVEAADGGTLSVDGGVVIVAGPAGAQGPAGANGQPGAAGPSGIVNRAQRTWVNGSTQAAGAWVTIPNSAITLTTTGGDVLVQMAIALNGGSHASCRTIVDGLWAGSYGGLASAGDPFWQEGLQCVGACAGGNWQRWSATRLYPGIPAGQHTFQIQCVSDSGTLGVCSAGSIACYWSILELR